MLNDEIQGMCTSFRFICCFLLTIIPLLLYGIYYSRTWITYSHGSDTSLRLAHSVTVGSRCQLIWPFMYVGICRILLQRTDMISALQYYLFATIKTALPTSRLAAASILRFCSVRGFQNWGIIYLIYCQRYIYAASSILRLLLTSKQRWETATIASGAMEWHQARIDVR